MKRMRSDRRADGDNVPVYRDRADQPQTSADFAPGFNPVVRQWELEV